MDENERIAMLVSKSLLGLLSAKEREELQEWIDGSEINRIHFEKWTKEENVRRSIREHAEAEWDAKEMWPEIEALLVKGTPLS